jgi:hypothetical protein
MTEEEYAENHEMFLEFASDAQFTLATNILKALENNQLEEAKEITKLLIQDLRADRQIELADHLTYLMKWVILWTQSLEADKPGEWASAILQRRWDIDYLRVEQAHFDDAYIQKEIDRCFDYAKDMVMSTEVEPFRIRKPNWEELFVIDHGYPND